MSTDLFRESPLFQSLMKEAVDEAAAKAATEAAQAARLQNSRELAQAALEGCFQTLSAGQSFRRWAQRMRPR